MAGEDMPTFKLVLVGDGGTGRLIYHFNCAHVIITFTTVLFEALSVNNCSGFLSVTL